MHWMTILIWMTILMTCYVYYEMKMKMNQIQFLFILFLSHVELQIRGCGYLILIHHTRLQAHYILLNSASLPHQPNTTTTS